MKNILVIDDEWTVLSSVKLILENEGHKVTLTDTVENGLGLFDKGDFDLVITDILLPGTNGITAIKHIRKSDKFTSILAISGAGQNGAMSYLGIAEMAGASQTLAKPFGRRAFLGAVYDCLSAPLPSKISA